MWKSLVVWALKVANTRKIIRIAIELVEELVRRSDNKIDDKILKALKDALRASEEL